MRSFWELRTLAAKHDVDLFCFYDDAKDKEYSRQLGHYCRRYYVEKLPVFWSRARALWALLGGQCASTAFFHSRKMSRQIQSALKNEDYDRIFVFSSSMARYVEAHLDTPKILDMVDVDSDKWRQYAAHSRWPWSWILRVEAGRLAAHESSTARRFDTTLVCTEAEARLLRSNVPEVSVQVLENYLDVTQYDPDKNIVPPGIDSWQPYIVFSGSMDYLPNVDAAQYFYREVFPLIRQIRPDIKFVIVGRNPHRSLRKLASDPSVWVTGSLFDIRPYLCSALVAVAPMRIARGVQNKVLESLAAGVPVVTTSMVATALDERLRSLVRVADNAQDFAASVLDAIGERSPALTRRLREGLRQYIEDRASDSRLEEIVRYSRGRVQKFERRRSSAKQLVH